MSALLQGLWRDEAGLILSAELVIILTVAVLGMIVGLSTIQHALLAEFTDLGRAFQCLNQSYSTPSYFGCMKWWGWGGRTSWVAGSAFFDVYDGCVGNYVTGNGCEILGGCNYVGTSTGCSTTGTSTTGCLGAVDDCVPPAPSAAPLTYPQPVPDPASKATPAPTTP